MLLLLYLLLGHLIGDFVLQSSELVRLKRVTRFGLYPHVALVTLATALVMWGSVPYEALVLGLVAATHLLVDRLSVLAFAKTTVRQIFILAADQVVHIAILVAIASAITRLGTAAGPSLLLPIGEWPLALTCGTLGVSFGGAIFFFEMNQAFAPPDAEKNGALLRFSVGRVAGMVERGSLYLATVLGYYPIAGVILAGRVAWAIVQPREKRRGAVVDVISTVTVVAVALIVTVAIRPLLVGTVR
jgi:hypothetical protein